MGRMKGKYSKEGAGVNNTEAKKRVVQAAAMNQ
jgi:hypothetical protein